jgi:hypothetical protein
MIEKSSNPRMDRKPGTPFAPTREVRWLHITPPRVTGRASGNQGSKIYIIKTDTYIAIQNIPPTPRVGYTARFA